MRKPFTVNCFPFTMLSLFSVYGERAVDYVQKIVNSNLKTMGFVS